jgi:hypothetical protein
MPLQTLLQFKLLNARRYARYHHRKRRLPEGCDGSRFSPTKKRTAKSRRSRGDAKVFEEKIRFKLLSTV